MSMTTEVRNLILELRAGTRGHGAFGESERYPPTQLNLRAAQALEDMANAKMDKKPIH